MKDEAMNQERVERARRVLERRDVPERALPALASVYERVDQRRRRRRVAALAALVLVLASGGAIAASVLGGAEPSDPVVEVAAEGDDPVMRFSDGTTVWSLREGDGCCHLEEATDARVIVRMEEGAARFEVTPDRERDFEVRIEDVVVSVIGTGFDVSVSDSEVEVNVSHGVVRVTSGPAAPVRLERGERATFSLERERAALDESEVPSTPDEVVEQVEPVAPEPPEEAPKRAKRSKRAKKIVPKLWKAKARAGEYADAARLLDGKVDMDDVEELFLAADAMRLTRRPKKAIAFLDRIVTKHSKDRRAPLAAITMARLVHASGDACAAAKGFAKATKLGARGSLGRDALIREAESWSECGEDARARRALERFVAKYPSHRDRADALLEGGF